MTRSFQRTAYRTDVRDADARAAFGDRSVYLGRNGRAAFALAWCAREGAYHYTALPGATTAILPRATVDLPRYSRVGRSLGYCDRCGIRREHHDDDPRAIGCDYRPAVGAIVAPRARTEPTMTVSQGSAATVDAIMRRRRTMRRRPAIVAGEGAGL